MVTKPFKNKSKLAHIELQSTLNIRIFSQCISLTNSWCLAMPCLTNSTPIIALKSYLRSLKACTPDFCICVEHLVQLLHKVKLSEL